MSQWNSKNFQVNEKVMVFNHGRFMRTSTVARITKTTVEVNGTLYNVDGSLRGGGSYSSSRIARYDEQLEKQLIADKAKEDKINTVRAFMRDTNVNSFNDDELNALLAIRDAFKKRAQHGSASVS